MKWLGLVKTATMGNSFPRQARASYFYFFKRVSDFVWIWNDNSSKPSFSLPVSPYTEITDMYYLILLNVLL